MKQYLTIFSALILLSVSGCYSGIHGYNRTCRTSSSGLVGCVNFLSPDVSFNRATIKLKRPSQAPIDSPAHMSLAMENLQHYCPMNFDDPTETPMDHFELGLQTRVFIQQHSYSKNPETNFRRQIFLNCFALSVYHLPSTAKTFYWPLYSLHPDLVGWEFAQQPDKNGNPVIRMILQRNK